MTLTPLPKQTIFERRRRARRDRVLLLAALLGGQLFFCGLMGLALDAALAQGRGSAAAWGGAGLAVGALAWMVQALWAFKAAPAAPGVPLQDPDPDDERHQAFRRHAQAAALAAGLGGLRVVVAPSPGLNAFCWLDEQGRGVLGVTEGLLARLDGPELQAVAAHQATHLAYEDARFLLFAASGFGFFDLLRRGLSSLRLRGHSHGRSGGGKGGGGGLLLAWALLWGLSWLAGLALRALFRLFAQGRKLHADAGAVAMTRDPLALAGALEKAGRGAGAGLELPLGLAPLLLIAAADPGLGSHPSLDARLRLLVSDAGQSLRHFHERARLRQSQARRSVARAGKVRRWWLHQDGAWLGPLALGTLLARKDFGGDSWVSDEGSQAVQRAAAHPDLAAALRRQAGPGACPRCFTPLQTRRREGVGLRHCPHCDGHAVAPGLLRRLITRTEEAHSLSTHKAGLRLRRLESARGLRGVAEACGYPPLRCPQCQGPTQKRFYDHLARVPVDVCTDLRCGTLWLDGGELELIQLLHEQPGLGLDPDSGRLRGKRGAKA